MICEDAIKIIKKFEGFSTRPYFCPGGLMTIGFGHVIKRGESFSIICKETAERILMQDIEIALDAVQKLITFPLTENQIGALASFTFNIGAPNLEKSTLRKKINQGLLIEASNEMLRFVYSKGQILPGLDKRRKEERELFLRDVLKS